MKFKSRSHAAALANLSFLLIASLLCSALFWPGLVLAQVSVERTDPMPRYRSVSDSRLSFTSTGDAYAHATATYPVPGHGLRWLGMEPRPEFSGTINGESVYWAATYETQYQANPANPWQPSSWGYVSDPLCGEGMEYEIARSGNNTSVACIFTPPPTPDCDCPEAKTPKVIPNIKPKLGDPILPSTGILTEVEIDYVDAHGDLTFTRHYRSDRKFWQHNFHASAVDLSLGATGMSSPCHLAYVAVLERWWCFRLRSRGNYELRYTSRDGSILTFNSATDYSGQTPMVVDKAEMVFDGTTPVGFLIRKAGSGEVERFDLKGLLRSVTSLNGLIKNFYYSDAATSPLIAPHPNLLIRIVDHRGRELKFTWITSTVRGAVMASMTDPSDKTTQYLYDEDTAVSIRGKAGNLTSVIRPDGTRRRYWYNEQDKTLGKDLPFALTGVTDENGDRHATFNYNEAGRAISTEQFGGVNKYVLNYMNPSERTIATDPLGTSKTYWFKKIHGVVKFTQLVQPAPSGIGTVSQNISYDVNGNLASYQDFNGNLNSYTYDLKDNVEIQRVEGVGTAAARTTTTEWDTSRLPLKIYEPKRKTTFLYDARSNLLKKTVQETLDETGVQAHMATTVGIGQEWNYEYDSSGKVTKATGPRRDIADVTTYEYEPVTGNLINLTNAARHITTFSNYDVNGRVGRIRAANGVVTTRSYSDRGWLERQSVTDGVTSQTTDFSYDGVGNLKKLTLPDRSTVTYTYDGAHRLTGIADSLGNAITYTLDNMGNRTSDAVKDPNGTLARQTTRIYDVLSRLQQVTGAQE